MENFIVWMDAENRREWLRFRQKLQIRFGYIYANTVRYENGKFYYIIMNNRCYIGIKLNYEDPNTAKIWAMISKHNAEMIRKYPTIKMSA